MSFTSIVLFLSAVYVSPSDRIDRILSANDRIESSVPYASQFDWSQYNLGSFHGSDIGIGPDLEYDLDNHASVLHQLILHREITLSEGLSGSQDKVRPTNNIANDTFDVPMSSSRDDLFSVTQPYLGSQSYVVNSDEISHEEASHWQSFQEAPNISMMPSQNIAENSISKRKSHYDNWRAEYSEDAVAKMYASIYEKWAEPFTSSLFKRCHANLSRLIRLNPKIREALLEGDADTLEQVAQRTSPAEILRRARKHFTVEEAPVVKSNDPVDGPQSPVWLKGPMLKSDVAQIMANLAEHWDVPLKVAWRRLCTYAHVNGRITSPTPLMNKETDDFLFAADLVYDEFKGPRQHVKPTEGSHSDILHQNAPNIGVEEQGKYIDYLLWSIKSTSQIYHSEEWVRNLSQSTVKIIHANIVREWVPWFGKRTVYRKLLSVNEYLQKHQGYIDKIWQGDTEAAYHVARQCVNGEDKMRRHIVKCRS